MTLFDPDIFNLKRDNKKIIIVQILENNYSGLYIDKVKYYYGGRI
jgi:hypothetical protein